MKGLLYVTEGQTIQILSLNTDTTRFNTNQNYSIIPIVIIDFRSEICNFDRKSVIPIGIMDCQLEIHYSD